MGDSFNIQISHKLIDRLARDEDKVKKKTKKPKPKVLQLPHQPQSKVNPPSSTQKSSSSDVKWPPLQPPMFLPVPPPPPPVAIAELEAIRSILRESEIAVEKVDKLEAEKLEELTQRAKELRGKEFELPYQKPVPCVAERGACLECYRQNLKDPLKCAQMVRTYADCARLARQQVTSADGK